YSDVAKAYVAMDRFDDAIGLLRQIVEADGTREPDRLALGMAYAQVGQIALCRHHLTFLASHATFDPVRESARTQLEQYERELGLGEMDQRLVRLQEASLREQMASPSAPAAVF